MTAKKASLLARGVFKYDFSNPEDLMTKTNIDVPNLLAYARDAAVFCTNNEMPNLQFAINHYGKEDVAMLDFSSKYEAVNASRVIVRHGRPLLVGLVGDSLLEVCQLKVQLPDVGKSVWVLIQRRNESNS